MRKKAVNVAKRKKHKKKSVELMAHTHKETMHKIVQEGFDDRRSARVMNGKGQN